MQTELYPKGICLWCRQISIIWYSQYHLLIRCIKRQERKRFSGFPSFQLDLFLIWRHQIWNNFWVYEKNTTLKEKYFKLRIGGLICVIFDLYQIFMNFVTKGILSIPKQKKIYIMTRGIPKVRDVKWYFILFYFTIGGV